MKTYNVALLLVLAVFNGVRYTEQVNIVYDWEVVHLGDGNVQVIEHGKTYEESEQSLDELRQNVFFTLYTKDEYDTTSENESDPCTIDLGDDDTLFKCKFDPTRPTRIIAHGWNNGLSSTMCTLIRDAYLATGDYNVIVAHWDTWASKNYISARMKVAPVGQYVGLFIDFLITNGMNIKDLIIVGHSLGAHIAGVASRNTTATVPLLIALDPAGPLFSTSMNAMMTKNDAQRVVALHTSAGRLGCKENVGDIDFWANGGSQQPGCGMDFFRACAHGRAYEFFAEAIGTIGFAARSSSSYDNYESGSYTSEAVSLGAITESPEASGNYYFDTNEESPYSKS